MILTTGGGTGSITGSGLTSGAGAGSIIASNANVLSTFASVVQTDDTYIHRPQKAALGPGEYRHWIRLHGLDLLDRLDQSNCESDKKASDL